jgi:hypothetical protein
MEQAALKAQGAVERTGSSNSLAERLDFWNSESGYRPRQRSSCEPFEFYADKVLEVSEELLVQVARNDLGHIVEDFGPCRRQAEEKRYWSPWGAVSDWWGDQMM